MEDLWRIRDMGYRLNDSVDRAEYDNLRKRFRDEEEALNRKNLLYGDSRMERGRQKKDP